MSFRELLERALARITGRFTRQQRRQAERRARKEAARKEAPPSPGLNRSTRRSFGKNRSAKHTRSVYSRRLRDRVLVHTTQPDPWKTRARNRRRNCIAKASRRANRPSR